MHTAGSPSGGNGETSDLQKGLQFAVVCEPAQRRRLKHLHNALHLPPPSVCLFFLKTGISVGQSSSEPMHVLS